MNKQTLIEKLLNEKAEKNNTIDLNAYALGIDDMYKALVLHGVIKSVCLLGNEPIDCDQFLALGNCEKCDKFNSQTVL